MEAFTIVAPIFLLIVVGFVASLTRLLPDGAETGLSAFAFSISVPALLFHTIATADFPAISPLRVWAAYFGAITITWLVAGMSTSMLLRRPAADGVTISLASVYGNVVMLGIPLSLATIGPDAASPMALILAVNTPVLWLAGTLQIGWFERKAGSSVGALVIALAADLLRNPIVLGIIGGAALRFSNLGLHPVADGSLTLLAKAGVPAALVALGASLRGFRIKGQMPTLTLACTLKLVFMPVVAWWLAFELFALPYAAGAVVVIFASMPTGANVYIFATRYQRVVNSASGSVALGTLLAVVTTSVVVGTLLRHAPGVTS